MVKSFEHWVAEKAGTIEDKSEILKNIETSGVQIISKKLTPLQIRVKFVDLLMEECTYTDDWEDDTRAIYRMRALAKIIDGDGDVVGADDYDSIIGEEMAEKWKKRPSDGNLTEWVDELFDKIDDGWEPDDIPPEW